MGIATQTVLALQEGTLLAARSLGGVWRVPRYVSDAVRQSATRDPLRFHPTGTARSFRPTTPRFEHYGASFEVMLVTGVRLDGTLPR